MIPVEVAQTPWHFTTGLDLLDHWQSLAAGLIAILAAVIAVVVPEFFVRRRARREIEAIRIALVVEALWLVNTMIDTHAVLVKMLRATAAAEARGGKLGLSSMGRTLSELRKPVIYPACADRIGVLGPRLAEGVVGFYGN